MVCVFEGSDVCTKEAWEVSSINMKVWRVLGVGLGIILKLAHGCVFFVDGYNMLSKWKAALFLYQAQLIYIFLVPS